MKRFSPKLWTCIICLFAFMILCAPALAQDKSVRPGINEKFKDPKLKVKDFETRFEVESREIYALREKIVEACKIKPGMTVADIGAGTGLFTRLFADGVGPKGKVYAVDIAPNFIKHIEKSARQKKLKNVIGVVCTDRSAKLPSNSVDLVFVCDTYHHFEFPHRTMKTIHEALKPNGQLVLIDFKRIKGVTREWIMNHVRAGQKVFVGEIAGNGFQQIEERDLLKENYFVRFQKRK